MSKRPIKQQRERASTLGTCLITSALAMGIVATPSIAHAQEPPGDTSNEERLAEARRQFDAGVSLLDDPDGAKYEDAYRAFKRAYELSKSAKVLGNIGFCAMKRRAAHGVLEWIVGLGGGAINRWSKVPRAPLKKDPMPS